MSLALARKYRPRTFHDVAVQSHVSTTLKGAIARGRVAHGYLLCGPRGVGKTTLARVLAMALNCERRAEAARRLEALGDAASNDPEHEALAREASEPCGECASCQRIWSGSASLDVVEIDAASNRGVDDARELRERAMYAPSGDDRYKVYIVDEAHMLTREAWNALLKILEEPPPRVVFVFATTEPQKIAQSAAPVLSRLQRFDFKRIGAADIKLRLERVLADERVEADADALAMIARAADGSMRDALSLTDQVLSMGDGRITAERVREALGLVPEDEFIAVLDLLAERRAADVFAVVGRLADAGVDFGGFVTGLADILRAQLAVTLGGVAPEVSEHARRALEERRDRFGASDLLRMLAAVADLEPRFRKSGQQQLLLETLLVRLALMDRAVELEEVLRGLGPGTGGGTRDEGQPAPSAARGGTSGGAGQPAPSGARGGTRDAFGRDASRPPVGRPVPEHGSRGPQAEAVVAPSRPTLMADAAPARGRTSAPTISAAKPASSAVPVFEAEQDSSLVPRPSSLDASRAARPASLDLPRVVGRWDELLDRLRAGGKTLLATALSHASPVAVTAKGEITIALDEPNEFYQQAFEKDRGEVVTILREWFAGVERVQLKRDSGGAPAAPPRRLTDEDIRVERLASLRKRDPMLGAAIDALDLDVAD